MHLRDGWTTQQREERQRQKEDRTEDAVEAGAVHLGPHAQVPRQQEVVQPSPPHPEVFHEGVVELRLLRIPPFPAEQPVEERVERVSREDEVFQVKRRPGQDERDHIQGKTPHRLPVRVPSPTGAPQNAEDAEEWKQQGRVFGGDRQSAETAGERQPCGLSLFGPVQEGVDRGQGVQDHEEVGVRASGDHDDRGDRGEHKESGEGKRIFRHVAPAEAPHAEEDTTEGAEVEQFRRGFSAEEKGQEVQHLRVERGIREDIPREEPEPADLQALLRNGEVVDQRIPAGFGARERRRDRARHPDRSRSAHVRTAAGRRGGRRRSSPVPTDRSPGSRWRRRRRGVRQLPTGGTDAGSPARWGRTRCTPSLRGPRRTRKTPSRQGGLPNPEDAKDQCAHAGEDGKGQQ